MDSESVRDEKVKVLRAIPHIEERNLVREQFRGYRDENGVAKDSQTETFAFIWDSDPTGTPHCSCQEIRSSM